MTRLSITWLALLLVASFASATTVEELCKGTPDPDYCLTMLKKTASGSKDLKSEEFHKKLLNQVLSKAEFVQGLVFQSTTHLNKKDAAVLKTCVQSLGEGVELIKKGTLDAAAAKLKHCSVSVEGQHDPVNRDGNFLANVKELADEATFAADIANAVIIKLNGQNPRRRA